MDQRYQIGNEYGSIVWDIGLLLNDQHKFQIREFSVDELIINNPFYGDIDYAMQTDISRPVVIVNLAAGTDKVIDGNHRLYRCAKEGISRVKAYYLEYSTHRQYIIDFDEATYWNIVNHWGQS